MVHKLPGIRGPSAKPAEIVRKEKGALTELGDVVAALLHHVGNLHHSGRQHGGLLLPLVSASASLRSSAPAHREREGLEELRLMRIDRLEGIGSDRSLFADQTSHFSLDR